jgi:hypothetical protein
MAGDLASFLSSDVLTTHGHACHLACFGLTYRVIGFNNLNKYSFSFVSRLRKLSALVDLA